MVGMTGSWNEYSFSTEVHQLYRQTLTILESLLEASERIDRHILSGLPLTAYSIPSIRMELRIRLRDLHSLVSRSDVDPVLGELVLNKLKLLIERKGMNRSDAEYASLILEELKKLQPFTTVEVENLLYQYDFNTPAFSTIAQNAVTA